MMMRLPGGSSRIGLLCLVATALVSASVGVADEPSATFVRGVNLNGPSLVVDGRLWEAGSSSFVECRDQAFENQDVTLVPATDPERARMIRSSRWGGSVKVALRSLPPGSYLVSLYVWEDNNSERFSLWVNDREVAHDFDSGAAGSWAKLGPFPAESASGSITITSQGGAANLSGVEVWTLASPGALAFSRDVQPVLAQKCLSCHGPRKQKGGLRLDVKTAAMKGGDSGEPAIVPGEPSQSRLLDLIAAEDDQRMPPAGEPLSAVQVEAIKAWIASGAEWPESASAASTTVATEMAISDEDRDHWAFRPLRRVEPPEVEDASWCRNPIDQFIRRAQEDQGITPADPADPRTMVRRLAFDLIGLPPVLKAVGGNLVREERLGVDLDLSGPSLSAADYETLVDRLLASPHHGERWARHWLDVARYADSDGQEGDADRPNAYAYRDFVIRSLNADRPYDEFVRWQIAGDEIAPENPEAIAATGFLVAGNSTVLNVAMEEEKLRNRANELDDMISTTNQAMLGLTVACARCHDHKYDPIPTRDYYRMMRIFNSGDRADVPLASPGDVRAHGDRMKRWQERSNAARTRRDNWLNGAKAGLIATAKAAKIARLPISDDEKKILRDNPGDARARALADRFKNDLKVSDGDLVAVMNDEMKATWNDLDGRLKAIDGEKPEALPVGFAFRDFAPEPRETWFFERGNFLARNERMDLGFLSVLTKDKSPGDYWDEARSTRLRDDSTQQRRAMAEWMTDTDQGAGALLARVIVNRVWQHHFGEGLARTVSDFGTRGELPSHPDLLEWLADDLVRHGWSLKRLHRMIVTSATYRQGTTAHPSTRAIDPENRLLGHRRPLRLEAEILRDAMLACAGTLNPAMFGPSFKPPIPSEAMQARNVKDPYPQGLKDTPETHRRTVYAFHKRVVQYPLSQAFDAPDAQVSCGRRVNTTVAPQALAMLNDPFVRARAAEMASRLQAEAGNDPKAQIAMAFAIALGREPEDAETQAAAAFLDQQARARRERDNNTIGSDQARDLAIVDFCQMIFALNEFLYVD